jgi:K+-transporting ATPase KdpF subunit
MDPGHVLARRCRLGINVCLCRRLRQGVKGAAVILLTSLITILLFVYLLAAMLRPEWF